MQTRQLSEKELKLKQKFARCGLEEIPINMATIAMSTNLFLVNDPVLYKIKNTNDFLLFGNPVDYSSVLKRLQESVKDPETLKNMGEEEEEEETVIDGEAQGLAKQTENLSIGSLGSLGTEEVKEEDIKLIMKEGEISKEEAIKALSEAENDVIQALVNISKSKEAR